MPLTTAAGGISIAEHLLAQTLAACTQWQVDVGAESAAQALARIHFHDLPVPEDKHTYGRAELEAFRPFALIGSKDYRLHRVAADAFSDAGTLYLTFQYNVPKELADNEPEAIRLLSNSLGLILRSDALPAVGLCDLAHEAGYLAIDEIRSAFPFAPIGRVHKSDVATQGDFLIAKFLISWGNLNA